MDYTLVLVYKENWMVEEQVEQMGEVFVDLDKDHTLVLVVAVVVVVDKEDVTSCVDHIDNQVEVMQHWVQMHNIVHIHRVVAVVAVAKDILLVEQQQEVEDYCLTGFEYSTQLHHQHYCSPAEQVAGDSLP